MNNIFKNTKQIFIGNLNFNKCDDFNGNLLIALNYIYRTNIIKFIDYYFSNNNKDIQNNYINNNK